MGFVGNKMVCGDYIVYVDESGDPTLAGINDNYPIFVLAFCVFKKDIYSADIIKNVQQLKFNHFGHDMVILHEREILKSTGIFKTLNKENKNQLLNDLNVLIANSDFQLIACVIHKQKLKEQYPNPKSPYDLAMRFGLECLYQFLKDNGQENRLTHIVFEQRGLNEDTLLQQEFKRVCNGDNKDGICYPFDCIMASKKVNSSGLQFADLVARPIGNHTLKPDQPNRAFDILCHKFYDKGFIIFPK